MYPYVTVGTIQKVFSGLQKYMLTVTEDWRDNSECLPKSQLFQITVEKTSGFRILFFDRARVRKIWVKKSVVEDRRLLNKVIDQFIPVVLFIMLYNVVLAF